METSLQIVHYQSLNIKNQYILNDYVIKSRKHTIKYNIKSTVHITQFLRTQKLLAEVMEVHHIQHTITDINALWEGGRGDSLPQLSN